MRQFSLFPLIIGLLNYRSRLGDGLPTTSHAAQLTEDEVASLKGGLSHAIRDAKTFNALFDFYIDLPDEGEADPMPEELRRRASEPDMPTVSPEELIRLATTPAWVAELRDAVVAPQPVHRREDGTRSGCSERASLGPEGAVSDPLEGTAGASHSRQPLAGRTTPWRPGIRLHWLLAIAAALLIAVVAWFPRSDPPLPPPLYGTRVVPANRSMGPGGGPEAARVIFWDVPPDMDGYIAVLEVSSAEAAEVRPLRDAVCQRVDPRPYGAEIELTLLFRPPPQGDKVVWLVLTDRPAAEALRVSVGSAPPGCDLRGPQYPRDLLDGLHARGVTVRAVGRVTLLPATAPAPPLP